MADQDHSELIAQFCALTTTKPHVAQNYLGAAAWNLEAAVQEYFTSQEEEPQEEEGDENMEGTEDPVPAVPGGGRTLGGDGFPSRSVPAADPAPVAASSSSSSKPGAPQQKKKFGSLRDFAGSSDPTQAGSDDDDDDNDHDPNLYAGGEKSGLAVQNPDDLKRKILEKAKRQAQRGGPPEGNAPTRRSAFTGRAQTLGGDEAPSQVVEDPDANIPHRAPRVERTLHFWQNGFSVDDGPLYRNDDPANAARLEMIRSGRAPYDILNVGYDQEADVKLEQHDEPYVQPKKQYKPFSGQGQRLGSPTPGQSSATVEPPAPAPQQPRDRGSAGIRQSANAPKLDVDDSKPTISLQVRLGDGTRLVSRFNTSHTIGDVYNFVSASNPASQARPWVLMTTFPSQELKDRSKVLGDMADFKRGGTVVQKWS